MPPKRKRGGASARGRRGRPPKKSPPTPVESPVTSPVLEQIETSSSNSSTLEEPAQPETKIKLETKIHKKFGIKYHVPDEVVSHTPKSLSPIVEDPSTPGTATTKMQMSTVSTPLVSETSEGSSSPADENEEKMETEVVGVNNEITENVVESEITEQLHHLEVSEGAEGAGGMDNIEMQPEEVEDLQEVQEVELEAEIVLEYVTHDPEDETGGEVVLASGEVQEDAEEVYYVVEEELPEAVEECKQEIEVKVEEKEEILSQVETVNRVQEEEEEEAKMDVTETPNVPEEIVEKPIEKKEKKKEEKAKIVEKPCRKSKRISLRGGKHAEEVSPTKSPVKTASEVKDEPREENAKEELNVPMSKLEVSETEPEEIKMETEVDSTISSEPKVETSEPPEIENKEKPTRQPKKSPAEKKKPGPKAKKVKDPKDTPKADKEKDKDKDKDKEAKPKEEKKKGKKQVTFKVQPKGKKVKEKEAKTPSAPPPKPENSEKTEDEDTNIRRSSRIKTISTQKVRSRGKGLVKKDEVPEVLSLPGTPDDKNVFVAPSSTTDVEHKPVKVKSRWRRSSELEMRDIIKPSLAESPMSEKDAEKKKNDSCEVERRLKQFMHLKENVYLTERISCKEAKKMVCDCFLTDEEIAQGEYGCGEDCLNRLLMIECGNLCTVGERCTNKRFQKMQSATVEAFATEKKGLGIRAVVNIPSGDFILEYVGEVLDAEKFEQRAAEYSKDKNQHYYFMALRADAVIDATMKGNISRFINHSCEPNAETQKWTVNGELRIGFFSKRTILAGEEITFDYQFQRYGKEAQKCFCEAPTCRGWLGEEPDSDDESDEEEDEEDEEEEVEEDEEAEGKDEVVADKPEKEEKPECESEIVMPAVKKVVKKERPPKKERKPRQLKPKRKPRLDRFEDLGLDEEIESLQATGLKNQAQTLKLSRLMVRAKEPVQRTKLLKLLKKGEFPCRRLFLDYHGLRLIHGWMTDAQHLAQQDSTMEGLRLEILQTLAMLPIPNKTMLQDSKVLPTVEKWSKEAQAQNSPVDSDSNSPQLETEEKTEKKDPPMETESSQEAATEAEEVRDVEQDDDKTADDKEQKEGEKDKEDKEDVPEVQAESETVESVPALFSATTPDVDTVTEVDEKIALSVETEEVRRSTGMEHSFFKVIPDYNVDNIKDELLIIFDDDFVPLEVPVPKPRLPEPEQPKYDILVEIMALALKLLEEWSSLKEVFRIPKKERIEQMKEHEREADRRYKALSVEQDIERKRDRYRGFQRGSRIEVTDRLNKDRDRPKTDRYASLQTAAAKMSKQERRELFARQAEEEERRRKQELWTKQNWMVMSQDPRMQGFDPSRNPPMQFVWNPQIGQYQNVMPDPNMQGAFNFAAGFGRVGQPHMDAPHGIQPLPTGMLPPNVAQPSMAPANMGAMPPMPNIPPGPGVPYREDLEDPSKVQFMGPIPPPAKLPPKWKTAKDKYGRPYYYHIKLRVSQWEPPECTEEQVEQEEEDSESTSSSDTSSLSSSSSSEDSDSEDDTKLMMDIRNKFRALEAQKKVEKVEEDLTQPLITTEDDSSLPGLPPLPALSDSMLPTDDMNISDMSVMTEMIDRSMAEEAASPLEGQIADAPPAKRRRIGLVQEHIISPRTEEDRLQFREDVKKYKLNKEMVRKQKEIVMLQAKKQAKAAAAGSAAGPPPPNGEKQAKMQKRKVSAKTKLKEMEANVNSEDSKKIKETFRTAMATVMVGILNPYRKPDCKEGRITATEDFKHLARKLTHFVMLKELKHCDRIEELECTESVKAKAKEFVRKYMAKFGEVYQRPADETESF